MANVAGNNTLKTTITVKELLTSPNGYPLIIEDGDQVFVIENNKVVASIKKEEYDKVRVPEKEASFKLGDRVSYREMPGNIISVTSSIYGDTLGVKFDNGMVAEYTPSQLVASGLNRPVFSSSVQELLFDFEEYSNLPANTLEEVEAKEREARSLNFRAGTVISNPDLPLSERVELDKIVVSTNVDVEDFKEGKELLRLAEKADYFDRFNQYRIDSSFNSYGSSFGAKDDASWLDEIEITSASTEESHLASLARDTVAYLDRTQLSNDDFMEEVKEYSFERITSDDRDKFAILLESARQLRLDELEETETVKEASVDNYLDDDPYFL